MSSSKTSYVTAFLTLLVAGFLGHGAAQSASALTPAEQKELGQYARAMAKRECAGGYGKVIYPEASEAMAVSTITMLYANPEQLTGAGPDAKKKLVDSRYEVDQKAVAQFVLRLKPGGPLTYQRYTHTTKGSQHLTVKQFCTLR